MSTCTHETMTNHHHTGILAAIGEIVHVWRARAHERRELARLSERDLHDAGIAWADMVYEAEKPFWRP